MKQQQNINPPVFGIKLLPLDFTSQILAVTNKAEKKAGLPADKSLRLMHKPASAGYRITTVNQPKR